MWKLHIAFGIVNQKPILAEPYSLPGVLFLFNKTNILCSFTFSSSSSPRSLSHTASCPRPWWTRLKMGWLLLMVCEEVAFFCWLTIDELYSRAPLHPSRRSPPSVSKLVRSDALPARAQMQITQQRSFISNQTREAAEHPGSSVPAELLYLRGSD